MATGFKHRPPIIEQLAAELQNTGGTVSTQSNGTVYRGGNSEPWDMSREWKGAPLENYSWRTSNWSKSILVQFFVESTTTPARLAAFVLHLVPPLTDEEIAQMAETYMLVLNMRRIT